MPLIQNSNYDLDYILSKIINKIIDCKIESKQITFNRSSKVLEISATTISDILYIVETGDTENFSLYRLNTNNNYYFKNEKLFKESIPNKICKKIDCHENSKLFTKNIFIEDFGRIKIIAKPDAFYDGFPAEIKSISVKNRDNIKFTEKYGRYQAQIYGYVLDVGLAYLIVVLYNLKNKRNVEIEEYRLIQVKVNEEYTSKMVEKIVKDFILPNLRKKTLIAAGGI